MTTSTRYSILYVLTIHFIGVCSKILYSIEMHSIKETKPYPTLYLQDNETIVIGCNDTDHIYSPKLIHKLYNESKVFVKDNKYTNVFNAEHLNGDTLQCIGKSNKTNEVMSGVVVLLSYMNKAYMDWNNCNDENYCLNRAQCYRDPDNIDIRLCVCPPSMGGYQCERTAASISKSLFVAVVTFISTLFLIAVSLVVYLRYKYLQKANLRKKMLCSSCNSNRVNPNHEDYAATTEATQTNNAVIYKGDYVTLPYIDANTV